MLVLTLIACGTPDDVSLRWQREELACVDSEVVWAVPDPQPAAVSITLEVEGHQMWISTVSTTDGTITYPCEDDAVVYFATVEE